MPFNVYPMKNTFWRYCRKVLFILNWLRDYCVFVMKKLAVSPTLHNPRDTLSVLHKKSRKITKNCMAQLLCIGVCGKKQSCHSRARGVHLFFPRKTAPQTLTKTKKQRQRRSSYWGSWIRKGSRNIYLTGPDPL